MNCQYCGRDVEPDEKGSCPYCGGYPGQPEKSIAMQIAEDLTEHDGMMNEHLDQIMAMQTLRYDEPKFPWAWLIAGAGISWFLIALIVGGGFV